MRVIEEAADIANFAMMIADNAGLRDKHAHELAEARGEGEPATGCPLAEVRAELDQVRAGLAVANQKLHRIAGIACEVKPHA